MHFRAGRLRVAARQHRALGFRQKVPDPASVRALFPSLSPVAEVDCVTVRAPWLDAGGDGWTVARRGRVVAFVGANLMKFGPLLGELLARGRVERRAAR